MNGTLRIARDPSAPAARAPDEGELELVLEDPSYLSSTRRIKLRRRRDRTALARRQFAELAGDAGVGNWCVLPEAGEHRLCVLAIDPSASELARIQALREAGVHIASIGSTLMPAGVHPGEAVLLRVELRAGCVRMALRLHGHWVFARREESGARRPAEIVGDTLAYLQAQGYLELPLRGTWELLADGDGEALQVLCGEGGALQGARRLAAERAPHRCAPFACAGERSPHRRQLWRRAAPVLLFSAVSMCLAYLAPIWMFAPRTLPALPPPPLDVEDAGLQREVWLVETLHRRDARPIEALSADLRVLLGQVDRSDVRVLDLVLTADGQMRVSCELERVIADPLQQRRAFRELQRRVRERLPEHRVRVLPQAGYRLGGSGASTRFEIDLQWGGA